MDDWVILKGHVLTSDDAERFWAFVDKRGPEDCWPWTGYTDKSGYGQFKIGGKKGKTVRSNQVAFALSNGEEAEFGVLHSCDNTSCGNPAHLRDGTQVENMADVSTRGRNRTPRPGNGFTKISDKQSLQIHKLHLDGLNFSQLARRFNITPPTARAHYRRHADGE